MTSENTSDNLNLGRGWLNRAAEMLDSCEDHVSDAEFARAAAAIGNGFIRLAAAEREAAAQAFVDERHAAERAEDLERIAANRTEDLERIAAADAKVWEHQDSEAEVHTAVVEAHRAMTARMQAEQAEIELRTAKLAELDVATLAAAGQREKRAEAEARPHDDEQPPGEAAYLLEGDDEVFTPVVPHDGFRGFTRHGHPVDGEPPANRAGGSAARCGGLHGCAQCAADAARLRIPGRTEADLDD